MRFISSEDVLFIVELGSCLVDHTISFCIDLMGAVHHDLSVYRRVVQKLVNGPEAAKFLNDSLGQIFPRRGAPTYRSPETISSETRATNSFLLGP